MAKYQKNRITTSVLTTAFPVWKVPFPAVTICNYNVVYKDHMKPLVELLRQKNVTTAEINEYFGSLSSLITSENLSDDADMKSYARISKFLMEGGYNTRTLMKTLSQGCNTLLKHCEWGGKKKDCSILFRDILTTNGYCCAFNYETFGTNFRMSQLGGATLYGVGSDFGLVLLLDIEESQYVSSVEPNHGLNILVHHPNEYPDMFFHSSNLYKGLTMNYAVIPQVIYSDDDVRDIDVKNRECYFLDEKPLLMKKTYNYLTCLSECKANVIMKTCGCVPFYFKIDDFKICSLLDYKCLRAIQGGADQRASTTVAEFFETTVKDKYKGSNNCTCLPQCNEISYSHHVQFDYPKPRPGFHTNTNMSRLNVYYDQLTCTQYVRGVNLTWDVLLANIGGLFGLCLGGSIISLIELVYHIFCGLSDKDNSKRIAVNGKGVSIKFNLPQPKLFIAELYPRGYRNNNVLSY